MENDLNVGTAAFGRLLYAAGMIPKEAAPPTASILCHFEPAPAGEESADRRR
jgi:hypothetical protein